MRKAIMTITFLVISSIMLANPNIFDPELYHSKSIIACFTKDAIGNERGILEYELQNGIVKTGLRSLDQLAEQYNFINLSQMHPDVKFKEFEFEGACVQNIYRITVEEDKYLNDALSELQNDHNLVWAEFEAINRVDFIPNDPFFSDQWHLPQIECPEAWDWTTGSDEIVIGIVDSGILWTHPDLQDNIWVNQAELDAGMTIDWENGTISGGNGIDDDGNNKVDDVIGWNFYNNNNISLQTTSQNDHGTHVGGCAGAVGNNGIGVSGSTMTVKLIVSKHTGVTPDDMIYNGYDGIVYCTDSGAHVINCSWGGAGNGYYANTIVNYANNNGVLVVGAAGNDDTNNDQIPHYPSDATNCMSVAATDQNDLKTYFSNYGTVIDISSPGIDIKSTIIQYNSYGSYQGTSMAAPIAAGACALTLSVHPELICQPQDLRSRMVLTTDYIDDLNPGYEGMLGSGRLNVYQAAMYDLIPSLEIFDYEFYEAEGDGDGLPNPGETCNIEIMIQNGWFSQGFWAEANDVTVTISTDQPEATIVPGTETFTVDYISSLGSYWNDENPFQITTPEDSNLYDLEFLITMTANQGSDFPYEVEHVLSLDLTLMQDGWPYDTAGTSTSSGIIVDLDNNGSKEIIFGDQNGYLHVVNHDGTPYGNFPIDFGGNISSAIAVGEIYCDGTKQIVFTNEDGFIYAIDIDGDEIFSYDSGGMFKGNPIIVDVDGDELMEIAAVSFTGNLAIVLLSDGTEYPNFPVNLSAGGSLGSPAVADLNDDGYMELLACSLSGTVYAISTNTGENLENWPYSIGSNSWKGPVVGNLDSDPDPEVIIASGTGILAVLEHDASVKFERDLSCQVKNSPIVGDINGDLANEIIVITASGIVYVMDSSGNDLGDFPLDIDETVESSPILADLDGDGSGEIIFGDNSGFVHAISMDGTESANYPVYAGSTIKVGPAIGDSDDDGDPEIIVPNQTGYVLFDHKQLVSSEDIMWAAFKYDSYRSGNGFGINVSNDEEVVPVLKTKLGGNYPNPFNPETTIYFSLAETENVTLEVYNIKGQKIRTLIKEQMPAGPHLIVWNGKDNSERNVSSGIYLYRLNTSGYQATKKMILMK